jgi:hypothetical protein
MESLALHVIDTPGGSYYPQIREETEMTAQRIQIGQVWRKVETGETFLVTKLYNEALATIAVLRPTGAATQSMIRIRVDGQGGNQALPGFSMAQENESN